MAAAFPFIRRREDAGMQSRSLAPTLTPEGRYEGGKFDVILNPRTAHGFEGDVAVPAEKSVGNPTIGASGQFDEPIFGNSRTEPLTLA